MASLLRSIYRNGNRLTTSLNKAATTIKNPNNSSNISRDYNNGISNNNSEKKCNSILYNSKIMKYNSLLSKLCKKNYQTHCNPYEFYHPLNCESTYGFGSSSPHNYNSIPIRSTTILCVRKDDQVVLMGDGQMTIGSTVAKPNARKLRKLNNNKVICGFAGAAADGISLVDLLEKKLSERDELRRACVETTKMWRTDKILRHLNALIIVADEKSTFELTGSGELVESDTGIMAVGSGGHYAEAAARALMDSDLDAEGIAAKAMKIAGDMCVYTNHNTMKFKIIKGQGIIESE